MVVVEVAVGFINYFLNIHDVIQAEALAVAVFSPGRLIRARLIQFSVNKPNQNLISAQAILSSQNMIRNGFFYARRRGRNALLLRPQG